MIVPMKVVTLLTLADDKERALTALQELGVMQIMPGKTESARTAASRESAEDAERTVARLAAFGPAENGSGSGGSEALQKASSLLAERQKTVEDREALLNRKKLVAPWGEFRYSSLQCLQESGVRVWLCAGTTADFKRAQQMKKGSIHLIYQQKGRCGFAVVSDDLGFVPEGLPLFSLTPKDDPGVMRKREESLAARLAQQEEELHALASNLPAIAAAAEDRKETAEFGQVMDALAAHGIVVSLQGFVPVPELGRVESAARQNGWGILIRDPRQEESVPVLIQDNRVTRLIRPLFDFLGIVPGYREMDVSFGVLIFFTIFYAIIIGDAGYGALFLILTLIARKLLRNKPAARGPLRLFLLLSGATFVWGALSGNWFGVNTFPWNGKAIPGLPWLTEPAEASSNVQAFCFMLAVAQLSTGRIWKAVHDGNLRSVGENAGWMLIIWGNFLLTLKLIVWPGDFPAAMYWLYGIGFLLVAGFGVRWNHVAEVFQLPFSIVGSFSDVLSYIRLFAVGMAGSCIAASFNDMGVNICRLSPWFILFGVLAILAGHLLNIMLCFMSVLVHGVRLNTLEFSNHTGLTWSGSGFHPFSKHQPKSEEK